MINEQELYHYGVMGMKWGRRRYQNRDGSLTNAGKRHYEKNMNKLKAEKKKLRNEERTKKKIQKLKALESEVDTMKKKSKQPEKEETPAETPEQKRARLLNSTDAKELYKNKDLLTTAELNDRINRIDIEARLKSKISVEQQKSGMDYVNDKMQKTTNAVNKAVNLFKTVDSAYSSVANSAIGKKLAKELGIEQKKKDFDLDKFWATRNGKSTQEVLDANKRLLAEESIRKIKESRAEAERKNRESESNLENAQKQVNDYFEKWQNQGYDSSGSYSKKGSDIDDSRTYTRTKNSADTPLFEYVEKYTSTYKDVYGEGKSKFAGWDKPYNSDNDSGENYVNTLLLEDKRYRK